MNIAINTSRGWARVLLCACLIASHAQAGMFTTHQVDANVSVDGDRQLIHSALARQDVRAALLRHGVDPAQAQQRIDRLTEQEVQQLARQFNDLPAASGPGLLLFATGPIMFMLELIGYTDLTTTF